MTLSIGDRVKHPTLHEQWGPGEVLAVAADGKVTVVFALGGQKILKGVPLIRLEGEEARHPLLDNRKAVSRTKRSPRPFSELREAFLRLFPGGFYDPKYLDEERDYKLDAGRKLHDTMSRQALDQLLKAGDVHEVVRRALAVMNATNLVYPNEKMDLKDGLVDEQAQSAFAEQLRTLLYGDGAYRPRFEAFIDVLERIGANKWPVATYFSFIAFPDEHMFLKPDVTKRAADVCNFELNYRVEMNWWTYESLLRFAGTLRELLADLKPRDNIDIQSFVFCIGERV